MRRLLLCRLSGDQLDDSSYAVGNSNDGSYEEPLEPEVEMIEEEEEEEGAHSDEEEEEEEGRGARSSSLGP
jgi:hypothetical protein